MDYAKTKHLSVSFLVKFDSILIVSFIRSITYHRYVSKVTVGTPLTSIVLMTI